MTKLILVATLGCRAVLSLMQAAAIVAGFSAVTVSGAHAGVEQVSRLSTGTALHQICRWSNPTQLPPKPDAKAHFNR